jgi:competence protein ComEA
MLPRAVALALVLAAALLPSWVRNVAESRGVCRPEGRGVPPRHWLGCAGDPGLPRKLLPEEELALGLPIDPNVAGERELAFVPGLSRRLARAVVEHRRAFGRFESVEGLLAVKGIGPRRLELARPRLVVRAER